MSLGTIGVVGGVVGTAWAIAVVSTIGRIVVGVFALCTTFTFIQRRFVSSGAIRRIKVLIDDFFNVSFWEVVGRFFACERSMSEELFLLFNRSESFGRAWCSRKSWSGARGLWVVGRMSDRRFSGGCFNCCLGGHNRRVNKSDYTVRG